MPAKKKDYSITKWFGANLATLLSEKIVLVYPSFDAARYVQIITKQSRGLTYTERIQLHAETLRELLPTDYAKAVQILTSILGPENPHETGMFTNFYWIMPIGKFVELYGLDDFDTSIRAIAEITKRNTGEYAIRPFIRKYPRKSLAVLTKWSRSKNFHLRRLAAEGPRPKLPWAPKLDTFIDEPAPVFAILKNLIEDDVRFVQKSVANNLADYFKVNPKAAHAFVASYQKSKNPETQWILKHATRYPRKQATK